MPAKKNPANSDAAPPSECSFANELIHALKDESVAAALGAIFENKLAELFTAMAEIKQESAEIKQANANLKVENNNLKQNLQSALSKIDRLEVHDRKSNLIINGLTVLTYA